MLFNSAHFLLFFPLVTLAYYLLPQRRRWMLLLSASCYFYMALIPVYILILALTITVDYVAGLLIERASGRRRRLWLVASLVANIGVLAVFKYLDFLNWNVEQFAQLIHWNYSVKALEIVLPVGLSFHTFQSMSYTIEVYRGRQPAERHFGILALYVMFYPQLVAGPIERPQNLLGQFRHPTFFRRAPQGGFGDFDPGVVTEGLRRMLWGAFKKIVIADRLAVIVNAVYAEPTLFHGPELIVATVFFAFQIYCDFSGYSDIALGSAQVMGFKLMKNFDRPYVSQSISEFWRRWHISLSTWFRDYLYISLGGNRVGRARWYGNLFVTFVVSGLWHGASWTFVVWGALNGFYLIFALWTAGVRERLADAVGLTRLPTVHRALKIATTFGLACVAWVFFRAKTLSEAMYVITHLFSGFGDVFGAGMSGFAHAVVHGGLFVLLGLDGLPFAKHEWAITFVLLVVLQTVDYATRRTGLMTLVAQRPMWARWAVYYVLVLALVFLGQYRNAEFLYFRF